MVPHHLQNKGCKISSQITEKWLSAECALRLSVFLDSKCNDLLITWDNLCAQQEFSLWENLVEYVHLIVWRAEKIFSLNRLSTRGKIHVLMHWRGSQEQLTSVQLQSRLCMWNVLMSVNVALGCELAANETKRPLSLVSNNHIHLGILEEDVEDWKTVC